MKHGPDGFVDVGDKLFIRAVRRSSQGQPFGRDADTSSLHVRYSIQRADGRIDLLRGKSLYLHRDRDWTALTSGKLRVYWGGNLYLTVLERRLGYILSPGDIDELFRPTAKCEMNAARCVESLSRLWLLRSRLKRGPKVQAEHDNALLQAGYFSAKAEAAVQIRPLAEIGLLNEAGRRLATAKRKLAGDAVRAAAHADLLANPHTSQSACASRVAAKMGRTQRAVERAISHMFEKRDLGSGLGDKRPKATFLRQMNP